MEELLYAVTLDYQLRLKEIEIYIKNMKLPEKRYERWVEDLASDAICLKRLAREKYETQVEIIKGLEKTTNLEVVNVLV